MPETSAKGERSFKANTEALLDELTLAYQWERPSLLLAVNRSSLGLEKARQTLQQKLEEAGHRVIPITIDENNPDVAVTLLNMENPSAPVFFVFGLEHGGGPDGKNAFRALNLSRELFVEHELKVVFWLTPEEASALSRLAPDFWAFRHRVIEYASPAPHLSGEMLARLLLWPSEAMPDSPAALEDKLRSLETTLAALPQKPESLALRIETLYLIGHAHWAAGDSEASFKALVAGMGLAQDASFAELNSRLLSGVGILQHERGRHQEALDIFQDLTRHDPEDGLLMMNAAVGLCSVGKNSEGIRQGERAVLKHRRAAPLWHILGHLQLALGKFAEALDCFKQAASLNPDSVYREALAICYQRMGMIEEALGQVNDHSKTEDTPFDRLEVISQALRGEITEAIRLLETGLDEGQLSLASVQHDANLNTLLDPALIAQILQRHGQ